MRIKPYFITFQFHYGTIKRNEVGKLIQMLLNFNSTMVRLKGHPLPAANGARTFQFHYGTIKSSHAARIHGLSFYFNSTMVRLKVHRVCPMRYPKKDFNSTMVRLKVTCVYHISMSREFQFHYGTIKRPRRGCKADAWRYFNSTMVRLKVRQSS